MLRAVSGATGPGGYPWAAVPRFAATLSADALNVTGDDTDYTILFDAEIYDIGAGYNPATGLFTAPVSGVYTFTTTVSLLGLAAGVLGEIRLVTSNNTFRGPAGGYGTMRNTSADSLTVSMALDAYLDAGDTASIIVDCFGGPGTKTVDVDGSAGTKLTAFTGRLVA